MWCLTPQVSRTGARSAQDRKVRLGREVTAVERKQALLGCWMLDLGMPELPLRDVQIFCPMRICLTAYALRSLAAAFWLKDSFG